MFYPLAFTGDSSAGHHIRQGVGERGHATCGCQLEVKACGAAGAGFRPSRT